MRAQIDSLLVQVAKEGARAFYEEYVAGKDSGAYPGGNAFSVPVSIPTPESEASSGRAALRGSREAAKFLRISTATFQSLKDEGKIKPTYQIGDTFFYDPAELRAQVQDINGKTG